MLSHADNATEHYIGLIENRLKELLQPPSDTFKGLYQIAQYATLAPAKRLRPVLMLMLVDMCKVPLSKAIDPACAIELIHTYSLIHDDLPCMDDDDYRRGQLAVHKAYSEAKAVLAGDFLLTYAFEVLFKAPHLQAEDKVHLATLLSKYCGSEGMIGGQFLDISLTAQEIDLPLLDTIYMKKTAALIILAIEFALHIANVGPEDRKYLLEFAKKIGLAFQITDDILDHNQTAVQTNSVVDYVSFLGVVRSKKQARFLIESALNDLQCVQFDTSAFQHLAMRLIDRSH